MSFWLSIYFICNMMLFIYAHDAILEIKKELGISPTVWPQFIIIGLFGIFIYLIAIIRK